MVTSELLLVRAACMRCHGTKCPLLKAVFFSSLSLFLFSAWVYFSPRRGYRRVLKFCIGFLGTTKIRFGLNNIWGPPCLPGGNFLFEEKNKSEKCLELPEKARKLNRNLLLSVPDPSKNVFKIEFYFQIHLRQKSRCKISFWSERSACATALGLQA